ncbi:MAG: CHASE2 domain-containing protein [bacterium]
MKSLKEKLVALWLHKWAFGAFVAFFSAIFALILATQFEALELKSFDTRFAIRGQQETQQDNIVIVALDEETMKALKTWPIPRAVYARAIRNLYETGARLIIVDIVFAEPSEIDIRNDIALAQAIKLAGNIILAGQIVTKSDPRIEGVLSFVQPPYKPFLDSTGAEWGIGDIDEDIDGFIRRYLLFYLRNKKPHLPLSLRAYLNLRYGSDGLSSVRLDRNGFFVIGDKTIPKFEFNSMLINFRGPAKSFSTYSLSSVIDDASVNLGEEDTDLFETHRQAGTFKDKIVFLGASAEVLHDNKFTPFFKYKGKQRKVPGVEVHANALSTLLRGDFISTQGGLAAIVAVFLLAGLTMLLTKWLKPFRGLFAILFLILFYFIITVYFFINQLLWVDFVAPAFAIILSYVGNVVHQTLTEQRERIRIKKSWQQYMSKEVIDAMLQSGDLPTFGGERRELTVLFSDIRGFTTFSERHTSAEVVKQLNEYLTEMVDVIFKNTGTLDKFVGDEIMAVYGAPHYFKDHAEKACLTALQMMARLRLLQKRWSARQKDSFQIGIGINSGKVILGNLGSSQLFDYTVIGDDVNLGARLEGANKQYGTTIIISEATYRMVRKKARARELDLVRVKGKKKPVKIYELRGMAPLPQIEQELLIDVYAEALDYYKRLKWYQALKEFKRILRHFPTDGPTRLYIKRCLDFIETPPPENWDGVFDFATK